MRGNGRRRRGHGQRGGAQGAVTLGKGLRQGTSLKVRGETVVRLGVGGWLQSGGREKPGGGGAALLGGEAGTSEMREGEQPTTLADGFPGKWDVKGLPTECEGTSSVPGEEGRPEMTAGRVGKACAALQDWRHQPVIFPRENNGN